MMFAGVADSRCAVADHCRWQVGVGVEDDEDVALRLAGCVIHRDRFGEWLAVVPVVTDDDLGVML